MDQDRRGATEHPNREQEDVPVIERGDRREIENFEEDDREARPENRPKNRRFPKGKGRAGEEAARQEPENVIRDVISEELESEDPRRESPKARKEQDKEAKNGREIYFGEIH